LGTDSVPLRDSCRESALCVPAPGLVAASLTFRSCGTKPMCSAATETPSSLANYRTEGANVPNRARCSSCAWQSDATRRIPSRFSVPSPSFANHRRSLGCPGRAAMPRPFSPRNTQVGPRQAEKPPYTHAPNAAQTVAARSKWGANRGFRGCFELVLTRVESRFDVRGREKCGPARPNHASGRAFARSQRMIHRRNQPKFASARAKSSPLPAGQAVTEPQETRDFFPDRQRADTRFDATPSAHDDL
jgi:hypothetical protein